MCLEVHEFVSAPFAGRDSVDFFEKLNALFFSLGFEFLYAQNFLFEEHFERFFVLFISCLQGLFLIFGEEFCDILIVLRGIVSVAITVENGFGRDGFHGFHI